ncbi:MAG: phospholipid carrier-dependent glycosyltransferase [Acidobacteria bacterium]|nr:MAG: phospholipid carrier-dependent glycosyltransferase [Acidobacteriota bacterium]
MFRYLPAGLLLCFLLFFWKLGSTPFDNQEARVGAVVQHMTDSNDLWGPRIGPDPYFNKPLLGHWVVLACSKVFGLNEATARLPSALAGLGVVWLTWLLARRWYGDETAVLAALTLAGSFSFIEWSRLARLETPNLLAVMAAFLLYFTYRETGDSRRLYAMAVVMAVGAHIKGLLTFAVPGFAILAVVLVFRDWKRLNGKHLAIASAVALALYSTPFLLLWWTSGTAEPIRIAYRENIQRLLSPFDHIEPFYFYGYQWFRLTLPWSILAPWVIVHLVRNRGKLEPETSRLLVVIAAIFGFFQLSASRRGYYLLPILPFTSILAAWFLVQLPALGGVWQRSIGWIWTLAAVGLQLPILARVIVTRGVAEAVAARYAGDQETAGQVVQALYSPSILFAGFACAVAGAVILWAQRRVTVSRIRVVSIAVCVVTAVLFTVVKPVLEPGGGVRVFAGEVTRIAQGRTDLLALSPSTAHAQSLIYYLRLKDCRVFSDPETARAELFDTGGFLLIRETELPPDSWTLLEVERGWTTRGRPSRPWRLYRPLEEPKRRIEKPASHGVSP